MTTLRELSKLFNNQDFDYFVDKLLWLNDYNLIACFIDKNNSYLVINGAVNEFIPIENPDFHLITKGDEMLKVVSNPSMIAEFENMNIESKVISVKFHENEVGYWYFETDIPHETFDILVDAELWCKGIIFSLDNL